MLRGRKVILRPYEEGFSDEEMAQLYRWSRDQEVLRWSGGSPVGLSLEEFKREFEQQQARPRTDRQVFAILTADGELIGRIGYFDINPWKKQAELGIVIGAREYWNQGYGSDAVTTLLRHIFTTTDLERIYLFTYAENLRAQRSFAKCGFRPVGKAWKFSLQRGSHEEVEMEIWRWDFEPLLAKLKEGANELHPQHRR
ncbi:MAG: GNAT family N-acetyltransferase [Anaerolineae bacterium]